MPWTQNYDPFGNAWLSTAAAAVPILLLVYLLAFRRMAAHLAALAGFIAAVALAGAVFGMPWGMVGGAVEHGLVFALFRICWTLIPAVFVYELAVESGKFEVVKDSIGGLSSDRRLQTLLIAFAFGAILEGAAGGGAPVAIAGAMMVGLGFDPFAAAVLCLIANTAPVAFGAIGNPIRVLVAVTGLGEADLSAMVGRILPFTAFILPFWLVRSMTGWRETLAVWPALVTCGGVFGAVQFYWSNYRDAGLVDLVAGMTTLAALAALFRVWNPARSPASRHKAAGVLHAWSPFLLMAAFVVLWGLPGVKKSLDFATFAVPVPGLHQMVVRTAPAVATPHAETAVFELPWLSAVGTGIFLAGLIAAPLLGLSLRRTFEVFLRTCRRLRYSMIAILAMLGLGYVTRYSGMDAVLGIAMTHTGFLYPFFGTLLGWLGVALTGTDAGSNALFGSLQKITAEQLGISPVLMAAANSAGGVMGKMIDAQSIIVACAAVDREGREGDVFRAVLPHSIALAAIVGAIVYWFAYFGARWIPSGRVWGG